jgi:multimeric flavodoxin WrbA
MRIIVLNGSPKGEMSVTMQYAKYMQRRYKSHEFKFIHVAQSIRKLEREGFDEAIGDISGADGVLWAFPLYVCAAHSNYMRFIELIAERGAQGAFRGKYTAALSTSIHFFDNTAHSYMRAVCDDLGMRYTGYFSPAMGDLTGKEGQAKLVAFTQNFLGHIERQLPTLRLYAPVQGALPAYSPGVTDPTRIKADNGGKRVLLITDAYGGDTNLEGMTQRLQIAFAAPVEVLRLAETNIKGGCLGCLKCGYDNRCAYDGSDDIRKLYNSKIANADIIVFAGALRGRFLSSRFKTFVDRRFLNTHQPCMAGKQIAYLISGPLGQNHNVVEILEAIAQLDRANLAGIVTDEGGDSATIDGLIDSQAQRLVEFSNAGYVQPSTFLGVGGIKIFRDEIFGPLRFVFRADHRYYKKHGIYDFPQKNIGMRLTNAVMGLLIRIPPFRRHMQAEMKTHMLMPYKNLDG